MIDHIEETNNNNNNKDVLIPSIIHWELVAGKNSNIDG